MFENQNSEKKSKGRDAQKGFLYQDVFSVYLLLDMLDSEKEELIKKIVVEGVKKKIEDIRVVFCDGTIEYYQVKTKDPPRNWSKAEVMGIIQKFLSEKTADNEKFKFVSDNNPDVHCKQLCDTIEKIRNSQELSESDEKILHEIKSLLGTTYQEVIEALQKVEIDIGKGKFESLYENTCHKAGMILGINQREKIDKLIRCILAEVFMRSSAEAPWKRIFDRENIKNVLDHCCQASQELSITFELGKPGNDDTVVINQRGRQRSVLFLAPPRPLYDLIGRDDMLRDLKQQLFSGDSVALQGLPGVGKTALAIELAYDPEVRKHFQDGVLWAGLGQKADILSHLAAWGAHLGIHPEEMANLASIEDRMKAVRIAIGMRRMLLVIDDAWQADEALALKLGGPNCAYLVTTRIPEVAIRFAGRKTPVNELSEADGLKVLQRLAQEVMEAEPDEARELVQAIGGLPLALIIMSSYLKVQTHSGQPRRLRRALDHLCQTKERLRLEMPKWPPEQYPSLPASTSLSLMAVIDISDKALDETSRRALRALSVFPPKPNSFSEKAALTVSAATVETLDTLTDYGLLESSGPARYTLHQVITDYAKENLTDETAYRRMAEYFVCYVEAHKTDYHKLDMETSNIFAALEAASQQGMHATLVRGVNAFYHFLDTRGIYTITEVHLKRALQAARLLGDTAGLVTTLLNLGTVARKCGDYTQAERYFQECLSLTQEFEDLDKISSLLLQLGVLAKCRGDSVQAEEYYLKGLAIAREIGHHENITELLMGLGALAYYRGDFTKAEEYSKEGLAIAHEIGNRYKISFLLSILGHVVLIRGEYIHAKEYFQKGLAIAHEIGHRERIINMLAGLGALAYYRGDFAKAEEYLQEGLAIAREIGYPDRISGALTGLGGLALNCGDFAKAEEYLQEGLAIAHEIGYPEDISDSLKNLGELALSRGDFTKAEEYLQEGLAIAREIGYRWWISAILNEWGELYLKQQKLESASTVFSDALEIAQELGVQKLIATSLYGIARVAAAQGNIIEARRQGQESLKIFKTIGHYRATRVKQ